MTGITAKAHRGKTDDIENDEGRDTPIEHVTAQPVGNSRVALDTVTLAVHYISQSVNPEAGSTARKIVATGHSARRGDTIRITASANGILEYEICVDEVTANEIIFVGDLSAIPAIADTFDILRPVTLRAGPDGGIAQGPITFVQDATTVTVTEDTVTPANNIPLPVKLTGVTGDVNITANDLNVQTSHSAANPDSVRVGDGVEEMAINASNEAQVRDDDANTELAAMNAKMVDGTDIGDVTVNNAAGAAAVNIQDGGNTISIDDDGGSITVDAVDLDIRDLTHVGGQDSVQLGDGVETVAVNASNELQVRDDDLNTTQTNMSAKFNSLGQKANAASAPVTLSTEQEALLTTMDADTSTIAGAVAGTEMQVDIVDAGTIATEATLLLQSAKLPASLGAKAAAASLSITFSNDEPALNVGGDDVVSFTSFTSAISNGAYVTAIADIGAVAGKKIHITTKTGESIYLATGAAASEANRMIIPAGGMVVPADLVIAANARLSFTKVTAGTIGASEIIINVWG